MNDLRQLLETWVRHLDDPHVGVDGAEGIVSGLGASRGESVENGGLPHIGEPDYTAVETHGQLLS